MDSIINYIPNTIKLLLPIITTIISSYIGYHIAKSNTKNERKLEIKQNSFDKIYLPLYRKLENLTDYDIPKSEALKIYTTIYVLIERNYVYVDPILIKLLKDLKKLIDNDKYYADKLGKIHYHIKNEYQNLRKYLSYPGMNQFRSFTLLDLKGKVITLLYFPLIGMIISIYIFTLSNDSKINILISISSWVFIFFFVVFVIIFIPGITLIFLNFLSIKIKQKKKLHM